MKRLTAQTRGSIAVNACSGCNHGALLQKDGEHVGGFGKCTHVSTAVQQELDRGDCTFDSVYEDKAEAEKQSKKVGGSLLWVPSGYREYWAVIIIRTVEIRRVE